MEPLVRLRRHDSVTRSIAGMPLDNSMDWERALEWPALVEGLDQRNDVREPIDERHVLEMVPGHEPRDLRANAGKLSEHGWADEQFARALRCLGFTQAVDAKQFGTFAWNTHNELDLVDGDHEVAISNATRQWSDRQFRPFPPRYSTDDCLDIGAHPKRLSTDWYLGRVKFVLVRHGETEWSASGKHTGRTDLALTASGRGQAVAIRSTVLAAIGDLDAASIWSSPLERAQQTARIVLGEWFVALDDRLREFDYGDYEGRTTTEIKAMVPGWTLWDGCPGGESMSDVVARVDSFIGEARSREVALTVVFAHGHLLRILAARALGQPGSMGRHLALDTASVSEIEDLRDGPAITRWNDLGEGRR